MRKVQLIVSGRVSTQYREQINGVLKSCVRGSYDSEKTAVVDEEAAAAVVVV